MKKRSKKLLSIPASLRATGLASLPDEICKSFLLLFFKKEDFVQDVAGRWLTHTSCWILAGSGMAAFGAMGHSSGHMGAIHVGWALGHHHDTLPAAPSGKPLFRALFNARAGNEDVAQRNREGAVTCDKLSP